MVAGNVAPPPHLTLLRSVTDQRITSGRFTRFGRSIVSPGE
jgi:hypothetical protein